MVCNKSDSEFGSTAYPIEATVWLSDSDIRDINTLLQIGGSGATIYYALVDKGIIASSIVSAPVAAIIGAAIVGSWSLVTRLNDGCGVTLFITIDTSVATPNVVGVPQT